MRLPPLPPPPTSFSIHFTLYGLQFIVNNYTLFLRGSPSSLQEPQPIQQNTIEPILTKYLRTTSSSSSSPSFHFVLRFTVNQWQQSGETSPSRQPHTTTTVAVAGGGGMGGESSSALNSNVSIWMMTLTLTLTVTLVPVLTQKRRRFCIRVKDQFKYQLSLLARQNSNTRVIRQE